jgi:hypothetical protein
VKPIAGTDSCQAAHIGYFVSGRMKVISDDGEEITLDQDNEAPAIAPKGSMLARAN